MPSNTDRSMPALKCLPVLLSTTTRALAVVADAGDDLGQLAPERRRHRVQLVRPRQAHVRDRVGDLDVEAGGGHGATVPAAGRAAGRERQPGPDGLRSCAMSSPTPSPPATAPVAPRPRPRRRRRRRSCSMSGVAVVRDGSTLLADVDWTVRDGERWVVLGPQRRRQDHAAAGRVGLAVPDPRHGAPARRAVRRPPTSVSCARASGCRARRWPNGCPAARRRSTSS